MSVLKSKRTISDMNFFIYAIQIRKDLTELLLRDFGIRNKIRKSTAMTKGMTEEDGETFQKLVEKYGCTYIIDEYPAWIVDEMRKSILNICRSLIINIVSANTIYPTNEPEYYERRTYQNRAIANCEQLLQEMQYIVSIIPVNANKFMPYVEKIEEEIRCLKGWRKGDNKILQRIKKDAEKKAVINQVDKNK